MPPFKVVIPARYASTRLPGKPLLDIGGKPMVVRVAERAKLSGAEEIWIATDHSGVAQAVEAHGFNACMTREDHASGTDRIAEVAASRDWPDDAIIVNVQGDEPLIEPQLVQEVVRRLTDYSQAAMSTACHPIENAADMFNPNVVKVVLDAQDYALYFSRAPIPYAREHFRHGGMSLPEGIPAYRHIGIYAYRAGFLKTFTSLAPAPIETAEALEQLRALWRGYRISVAVTGEAPAAGIDTPEDLEKVRRIFDSR